MDGIRPSYDLTDAGKLKKSLGRWFVILVAEKWQVLTIFAFWLLLLVVHSFISLSTCVIY
jgi:hypothetical protein